MIILVSCEGPRDRRQVAIGSSNNNTSQGGVFTNNTNSTNNSEFTNSSSTITSPSSNNSGISLPAEFSNCPVSLTQFAHYHQLIGEFNICKSQDANSNKILFQSKNSIQNVRVCFFPTSDQSGMGSIMIGNAQCLYALAGKIEYISLLINRSGFTDKKMNGVMIVKDNLYGEVTPYHTNLITNPPTYVNAYEDCMIYLYNTGDSLACQRFKSKGNYIYVSF